MRNFMIGLAAIALVVAAAMDVKAQTYMGGGYGTTIAPQAGRDNARDLNANVGYDFGMLRLEADYDRLMMGNNGGGAAGKVDAHVLTGMLYLEHDVKVSAMKLTPFVGGGAGWAWLDGVGVGSGIGGFGNSDNGGVYVGAVGVSAKLTDDLAFVTQYRYIASTTAVKAIAANGTATGRDDWRAQTLTMGLRYSF